MDILEFAQANAALLTATCVAVFVIDYFANAVSFGNRLGSAIVTALALMVVLAGTLFAMGEDIAWEPLALAGALMFAVAYLGNVLTFSSKVINALVTALIFLIPFTLGLMYLTTNSLPY
ncbi:MAG: hypothetical protein APF80_06730 [Alphaproteobacteria bacterium BRH_c36]|nr:MAG: hypothetical protein APF80_06730 [Alphaproteobacteria bacterium BRH_c36]